jgi:uncharacterized protein (DUF169 family)
VNYTELAELLRESLGLELPPVALRVVQEAPAGVRRFQGDVPSACTFWRRAEGSSFYAESAQHLNCLVGAHTMGLQIDEARGAELMELIGQMQGAGYLDPDEVAYIPTVPGEKAGIVYGPLSEFQGDPDVVLVWLTAEQAMWLQEASGSARWSPQSGIKAFGRPSCAAIPAALAAGAATLSLGCAGMRTFTEIPPDRLLGVLPGNLLDGLAAGLQRMQNANEAMQARYQALKTAHRD